MLTFIVVLAGGRGPDVWDDEFVVKAEDFDAAYERAKEVRDDKYASSNCDIVEIRQDDDWVEPANR